MEEESKILPGNPNDQLYHILKADTFTFCLICLEHIDSTSDGVGQHLTGTNHTGSIKRLFKACNPSLLDEIENERFADIVSKSVFDISVLLGKKTCYVSKKAGLWFCLMCEKNIIESNDTDASIKTDIIDHVLSDSHVKNVKGVCFLYRLNANEDFLLLNKSVVYCSVCKDVMQCKELDLLETAVVHLEMKHPNCVMTKNFKLEPNKESSMTEQGFVDARILADHFNTQTISRTEMAGEGITFRTEFSRKRFGEHFDERGGMKAENLVGIVDEISMHSIFPNHNDVKKSPNKKLSSEEKIICICLFCKKLLKPVVSDQSFVVTLSSHFKQQHPNFYLRTPLEHLINWVTFHNDPDKIKLFFKVRKLTKRYRKIINKNREIKKHLYHISKTETDYVCIICMVSMSSRLGDDNFVLEHLINHFGGSNHNHCEEEKMKIKQAFKIDKKNKTIIKLTKEKKILKEKCKKRKDKRKAKRARQIVKKMTLLLANPKLNPSLTNK